MTEFTSLVEHYQLLSYQELDSTNAEALRLLSSGGSHGTFIWAKEQKDGKGRNGKSWISKKGNLFVSVLLSPELEVQRYTELSFVTALVVKEMLAPIIGEEHKISLKWPNDVLMDNKKVAGILLENVRFEGKDWLVIGVGVNVDSFPDDVLYPATCLTEAGVQIISAKIALSRFIHHFIGRYDSWNREGFDNVISEWKDSAYNFGEHVEMISGNENIRGIFRDINKQGHMVLELDDKSKKVISSGEMSFLMEEV